MKLGNYEWDPEKDLIAEGAFAEVFRARDRNSLGRTVALKIYKESVAKGTSSSAGQKKYTLEKEFQKVDGLSHTNIISYFGLDYIYGQDSLGRKTSHPVLIMEYADGGTLSDFLKTNPDDATKHKLIRDIVQGLGYLHGQGILHRDLKPGNILISKDRRGNPVAKITDFGISQDILTDRTVEQSYTEGVGTPHYMAPEQFAKKKYGLNGELSEKTDLWALGVIVYRMVTGRMPFGEGETDYEHIREAILEGKADMTVVPEPFRRMVDKCLQAPASKRATDAESLLANSPGNPANPDDLSVTANNTHQELPTLITRKTPEKEPAEKTFIPSPVPEDKERSQLQLEKLISLLLVFVVFILAGLGFWQLGKKGSERGVDPKVEFKYHQLKAQAELLEAEERWPEALEKYRKARELIPNTATDWQTDTSEKILSLENRIREETYQTHRMAWDKATKGNDLASYQAYLAEYPDGPNAVEATRQINNSAEKDEEEKTRAEAIHQSLIIEKLEQDMVFVAGGTFAMGCTPKDDGDCRDNEKPVHQVTVSSFNLSKYEVTQSQWRVIMGTNPSDFSDCNTCPVTQVSWDDVQEFLERLNALTGKNYRLPTEAEWEYAAKGGNRSRGYKFSGSNSPEITAWIEVNSGQKTRPVGQKVPNELGIYDMSGNVYEWCSDLYGRYNGSHKTNPRGHYTGSSRVIRGGGWSNSERNTRISDRLGISNSFRGNDIGFRIAL